MNRLPLYVCEISSEAINLIKERMRNIPEELIVEHLVSIVGNLVGHIAIKMFKEVAMCADDAEGMYKSLCDQLHLSMLDCEIKVNEEKQ